MKVSAIVATGFAALASAAPAPAPAPAQQCTPATYACTRHDSGWKVCNTSGNWEVSNTHEIPLSLAWPSPGSCFTDMNTSLQFAGSCPPKTVCKFFKPSLSPYCVPPDFTIPN